MMRRSMLAAGWAVALATLGGPAARADEFLLGTGTRSIQSVAANHSVGLKVSVDKRELNIGEQIRICFVAQQEGFVTLWDASVDGSVSRIYPDPQTALSAEATRAPAGQTVCAGRAGDRFQFTVGGPAGMDTIYGVWTAALNQQPTVLAFNTPAAYAAALDGVKRSAGQSWSTATTTFDIRDPQQPAAPSLPPAPAPSTAGAPSSAGFAGMLGGFGQLAVSAPSEPGPAANASPSGRPRPDKPPRPTAGEELLPQQSAAQTNAGRPRPNADAPSSRPTAAAPPPQPAPPAPAQSKVVVLSMGANVDPLTKTNQDAQVFLQTMVKLFNIPPANQKLIKNVHKAEFKSGVEWIGSRVGPNDLVLVYFSGHGSQAPDPTRTSADGMDEAFVPYDFEEKRNPGAKDLVWSQEYARWINALPTDNVITIADACHSAGLTRSFAPAAPNTEMLGLRRKSLSLPAGFDMTPPDELAQPLTRAASGRNRVQAKGVLLAAARRDQSALEGSNGGVFTLALMDAMLRGRGTMAEAVAVASRRVNKSTDNEQSPQVIGQLTLLDRIRLSQ